MGVIGIFLFLLFLLPAIGIAILIGYVIKKSLQKKTPEFLATEKAKMEEKVRQLSKELRDNNPFDVTQISNNLSQFWVRGIARKSSGHVLTMQGEPIIAFQRIERGLGGNARILASSTSFTVYYELQNKELEVFYNSTYLGKLDALHNIVDAKGQIIGKANRFTLSNGKAEREAYPVFFDNAHIADIAICFDMRTIERNLLYRMNGPLNQRTNPQYIVSDPKPFYPLVKFKTEPSGEALIWLTSLATFESIYYTLDFV